MYKRQDLISVVGTRDYDVNEGDAVLTSGGGEAVNTVTTPTLSRTVSSSSGGSSDPTPGTDNDSDPAVEIPDGNVPLTETPEVIVPDTDVPLVDVPGLEAVSYTHLDVYKRQRHRCCTELHGHKCSASC